MHTKHFAEIGFLRRAADAYTGSPASQLSLWFGLVLVILCAVYASHSRLAQLSAWHSDPEQYVAAGVPMMTTLDAYYSLRLARLHAAGKFIPWGPVPARHYSRPELGDSSEWYDQREPKILPLLSRMLAHAATFFDGDIDRTALVFSPLLASFFMVPLFWYCWRVGFPRCRTDGRLVATFCLEYYRRTGVGWIDTDCLNLFFPWTVSCVILAMRGELRRQTLLLLSAAAGAMLYIFFLWYGKPGLTLAYLCALVIHLSLAGVSWRRVVLCALTLIVFANPIQLGSALGNLQDFAHHYLWPSAASTTDTASAVRFPQVWATISEARSLPWADTLKLILPRAEMAVVGLGAFALFAVWRWRAIAALSPMLLLGALALPSSRRFIPYLAPFVGNRLGRNRFFGHAGAAGPARRKFGRTGYGATDFSARGLAARGAFLIEHANISNPAPRMSRSSLSSSLGWRRCPANYSRRARRSRRRFFAICKSSRNSFPLILESGLGGTTVSPFSTRRFRRLPRRRRAVHGRRPI
jgi:hypothetical protein